MNGKGNFEVAMFGPWWSPEKSPEEQHHAVFHNGCMFWLAPSLGQAQAIATAFDMFTLEESLRVLDKQKAYYREQARRNGWITFLRRAV